MKRVAIIGGGLAGTACAFMLSRAGFYAEIYEAGACLAPGASGNALGLYNPRFSAERGPEAEYYAAAFRLALGTFASLEGVDWNPCGSLHLMTDEKRETRYRQMVESWGWPAGEMQIVDAAEASRLAGVDVQHGALWLAQAGYVSPKKLCESYAQNSEVHLNAAMGAVAEVGADIVILANGMGVKNFAAAADLPLNAVRGQLSFVRATAATEKLKCNLCYGGYFSPAEGGVHALGSTFQRWLDHSEIIEGDDRDNIAKLGAVVPALASGLEIADHRAAVRTAPKDHFPVVGRLAENLYVSTGHGSHGILSSLMGAKLLLEMIMGKDLSVSEQCISRLSPARFG